MTLGIWVPASAIARGEAGPGLSPVGPGSRSACVRVLWASAPWSQMGQGQKIPFYAVSAGGLILLKA